MADDSSEVRYQRFLSSGVLPKEEFTKLQIAGTFRYSNSSVLTVEVQNGLRNSVIVGIIVAISYKDEITQKEKETNYFIDCGDALPLTARAIDISPFQGDELQKLKPSFLLKEVRVRKLKKS